MNFIRMGVMQLDEFKLLPERKCFDGSGLSFCLSNTDVLERAHFYDAVEKASLNAYVTYIVEINCAMRSGHTVRMGGTCTPQEYRRLLALAKNIK